MPAHEWRKATLRENFLGVPKGTTVVSIPNPTKYTAVGKTFYVFTGKQLFVVAESYGGPNMMGLLKWGELHKKQAKLAEVLPKYLNKIAKPVKICDIMKVHRHPSNALLNF